MLQFACLFATHVYNVTFKNKVRLDLLPHANKNIDFFIFSPIPVVWASDNFVVVVDYCLWITTPSDWGLLLENSPLQVHVSFPKQRHIFINFFFILCIKTNPWNAKFLNYIWIPLCSYLASFNGKVRQVRFFFFLNRFFFFLNKNVK